MKAESDPIDLTALDPTREPRWEGIAARVASRAVARRQLRRAVRRRGSAAVVLALAAAVSLWWLPPRRPPLRASLLDWAAGTVDADDVLSLGAPDAH